VRVTGNATVIERDDMRTLWTCNQVAVEEAAHCRVSRNVRNGSKQTLRQYPAKTDGAGGDRSSEYKRR